ncbi:MAG: 7-cyano-7-deazaguanine synthase QueC [Proteobacteria bacterium]|nr:7-cyano-7-deazaguanine synthase QueC [Pseudomonadota bacterium]NBP13322.1 7-cyano-7-deazaguanine synthase QueC [bacterium]
MKKAKVVVPISGGMDSTVILYKAVETFGPENVYGLSYDYGQRHKRELNLAEHHVKKLKIKEWQTIDTSFIKTLAPTSSLTNNNIETPDIRQIAGEAQPKSYVPNRNMIFLSIAASYAEAVGAKIVYHGATKVDSLAGYWDASPEFLPTINSILALNRETRITIEAPLIDLDKADIVKEGIRLKVKFSKTYTCYSGNNKSDANSPSSALRIKGFAKAGYIDPLPYKQDLSNIWKKYNCRLIEYDTYNT